MTEKSSTSATKRPQALSVSPVRISGSVSTRPARPARPSDRNRLFQPASYPDPRPENGKIYDNLYSLHTVYIRVLPFLAISCHISPSLAKPCKACPILADWRLPAVYSRSKSNKKEIIRPQSRRFVPGDAPRSDGQCLRALRAPREEAPLPLWERGLGRGHSRDLILTSQRPIPATLPIRTRISATEPYDTRGLYDTKTISSIENHSHQLVSIAPPASARETTMFCGFRIFPDKKCFSFRKTASGKNDGNVAPVRSTTCTARPEDCLESRSSRFRITNCELLS